MGLKINRENNLESLFDKFAIDPTKSTNNQEKDTAKKSQKDKSKNNE
ncbi:SPJ_0845 family protein [Ligilactobacillus cholophilus]|nr:SPJ_0845 family protein [Ligilactobacillus cholophilus]